VSAIEWLAAFFAFAVLGAPALGAAVWSLTTEKAHEMIWQPLKAWIAAHPLLFRSIAIALGCFIVSRFIGWLAWIGLMLWVGALIWKYWREPWVIPAWKWLVAKVQGARPYRYDGEQAAHAEQAGQTLTSLSLMATADDSPEQTRMATEIEDDAERRLAVLLGKAILSLEEKRERDAIQKALQARRASFDAPVQQVRPLFRAPSFSIGGPIHWYAIGALALGLGAQELRVRHVKAEEAERTQERDAAIQYAENQEQIAAAALRDVDAVRIETQESLELIEEARAREARLRAREQRRAQANPGGAAVDYGSVLRDFTIQPLVSGPAASGDPAGGMPSGPATAPAD